MRVQGEDKMFDIKSSLEDVENLKNKREERNTAQDHRPDVVDERLEKNYAFVSARTDFFFYAIFQPGLERRFRMPVVFIIVGNESEDRSSSSFPVQLSFRGTGQK